jgi:ABC-type glycerol-3-phosphate transport system permease component
VASLTAALAAALGTPGAYALARRPVRGRRPPLLGVVPSTAFPAMATVAPRLEHRALRPRDTWWVLVPADTPFALPLVLWPVAGSIREPPWELEEAAFVDGVGRGRRREGVDGGPGV